MSELEGFIIRNDILIEYVGTSSEIIIPADVAEIGPFAFSGNKHIKKLVIPSNVKRINAYAFDGCSNLVELDMKENVEYLGRYCFRNCNALEIIHFPSTLSNIEATCFGVEEIGGNDGELAYWDTFGGNMNVKTIYVAKAKKRYHEEIRSTIENCLNIWALKKSHKVTVRCLDGIFGEDLPVHPTDKAWEDGLF